MNKKLTIPQAAKLTGKSRQLLLRYVKDGRLPAERIGHAYLINDSDLTLIADLKRGRPFKTSTQ